MHCYFIYKREQSVPAYLAVQPTAWSGSRDNQIKIGFPTTWSSGTNPQKRESAELWRLSPIISNSSSWMYIRLFPFRWCKSFHLSLFRSLPSAIIMDGTFINRQIINVGQLSPFFGITKDHIIGSPTGQFIQRIRASRIITEHSRYRPLYPYVPINRLCLLCKGIL